MAQLCVIFDLDGTLVDSEYLCNRAFIDLLPELEETAEALIARYRGRQLALILRDLEGRLGRQLPPDFEAVYRARVSMLFETALRPTPGTIDMLKRLKHARCVASSSPLPKIAQALRVTQLAEYFGNCIFSAYQVGSWKPEPGLFLHAAQVMGYPPSHCVVVEDSLVGLQAAATAGMMAFYYSPSPRVCNDGACRSFDNMQHLPDLIDALHLVA